MAELLAIIGTSLWMMRTSMNYQRKMSEKFIEHLQHSLAARQEENRRNCALLKQLTGAIRRNSRMISKLKEDLYVAFGEREHGEAKVPNNGI